MQELVLRLFEEGIMTAAQGAQLLNMDRLAFERLLAANKVPLHGPPEDPDVIVQLAGKVHIPPAVKDELDAFFADDRT